MTQKTQNELLLHQARIRQIPEGWTLKTIGEACSIRNDLRMPISVTERRKIQGKFPYYGPTGVLGYIKDYRLDGKYALIGEDGDHFLKCESKPQTLLVEGKFNVNNHAHVIEPTPFCIAEWFYCYFRHRNITNFLTRQGAGRYKLNKETLQKMPILLPPIDEQEEIAAMLSTWDEAIGKTEKLIEVKEKLQAGLIQRLLWRNPGRKHWETHALGEFIKERNEKSTVHNQYPIVTSSRRGIYLQEEYFSKKVASADTTGYKVILRSDFTYRSMTDDGVFVFNQLKVLDAGIISPAYGVFYPDGIDANFLYYYLNSEIFARSLNRESQGGTRKALRFSAFKDIEVDIPLLREQETIGRILNHSAKEITLERERLGLQKKQKRGLLQKLLTGEWRLKVAREVA